MPIRVAINGFGRIGRNVLRAAKQHGATDIDFVAVNDLTDTKTLGHLLRHDSVHRHYPGTVETRDNSLVIDGDEVRVFAEKDPAALPWGDLGVDIVIESTGRFTSRDSVMPNAAGSQGYHLYAYAANNPVTRTDPTDHLNRGNPWENAWIQTVPILLIAALNNAEPTVGGGQLAYQFIFRQHVREGNRLLQLGGQHELDNLELVDS